MNGGDFIRNPDRRAKLLVAIQGVWVATLLVLILWWGTLLTQQAEEIAKLETQLGVNEASIQMRVDRTIRMITAESSTFVLLILITNGVLVYLFIRDHRRSKSLQAFFASITHELRTPLTSIKLQAETLRDIEDDPKHAPFVGRLLEDVQRLEGQVQQTLELARLEGGGILSLQSIPIRAFIKNKVVGMYENSSKKINYSIHLEDDSFKKILADQTALTMIFRNFLDNAIKYSKESTALVSFNGSIHQKKGKKYFILKLVHENAQFSGDDSQLGNLFYRGNNSQGAGVGLYLIKSLMQKMKGSAKFSVHEGFSATLAFLTDQEVDEEVGSNAKS